MADQGADAIFIAVGTPTRRGDGSADLSFIYDAINELSQVLNGYITIITKSTVPVGTNQKIAGILRKKRADLDFDIVSNPEFLREGAAIKDFMHPDRVIVGLETEKAKKVMAAIYKPLYLREFPIVYTSLETAEMIKYASNAFLATKISFINEIANLCESTGADVKSVALGMGLDGRIGKKFLHAGPGFGGSCFPKDTAALVQIGQEFGVPQKITETVIKVNHETKERMVKKIIYACDGSLIGKIISILGVTFKPDTDDMRDAPSLTIIPKLIKEGAVVRVYDPFGVKEGAQLLNGVEWFEDPYDCASKANCLVILTEWNQFRALDLKKIAQDMEQAILVDLRNIYEVEDVKDAGFQHYNCIGRIGF